MRTEQFIGRVSDGIGAFIGPFRDIVVEHAEAKAGTGRRRGAGIPPGLAGLAQGRRSGRAALGPGRDRGPGHARGPLDAGSHHGPPLGHLGSRGHHLRPRRAQGGAVSDAARAALSAERVAVAGLAALATPALHVEAQRILFNMIAGSVALNGYSNIFCHHIAVGEEAGAIEIPQFDYNQAMNFGSVEFGEQQRERLSQERGSDPDKQEFVEMRTLDSFNFPKVDILKVDVEGMEPQVLRGADALIDAHRPLMLVEHLKSDSRSLADQIVAKDYRLYALSDDFICIPNEMAHLIPDPT
jgi:FkbM family methyltransferase